VKRALLLLAACGPAAKKTAPITLPIDTPVCKFSDDDHARIEFLKAAAAQVGDDMTRFHTDVFDPDYVDPDPQPPRVQEPDQPKAMESKVDPGFAIHLDAPKSLPGVISVSYQFGYDGIYSVGVAGVFVGCTYYPLSKTFFTPDATEPSPPDALVALGWTRMTLAQKKQLAESFILDVMARLVDPLTQPRDGDFGVTFTDEGVTTTTPAFGKPATTPGADGAIRVEMWTQVPGNMASQEDDGTTYRELRYTVRGDGAIVVRREREFTGPRQSLKRK
jgi:hypothetical protein